MKYKKIILTALGVLVLAGAAMALYTYRTLFGSAVGGDQSVTLFITDEDTPESVQQKLETKCINAQVFKRLAKAKGYRVHPGKYVIAPGDPWLNVYRKLRSGAQTPVQVTVPATRTLDTWAEAVTRNLHLPHGELLKRLQDPEACKQYGLTPETMFAFIVPNTYEMWWNVSLDDFMARLAREYEAFWSQRDSKCKQIGMTRMEVATLASIIDEETNYGPEKARMAGMYINRLHQGMNLGSCPTVKYAVGDWTLKRVLNRHLRVQSPYNTYINPGLPPGPIRIATIESIDAVLNYEPNDYLFICAKEDFSGSHNFARTAAEHEANAKRYRQALDERGIK